MQYVLAHKVFVCVCGGGGGGGGGSRRCTSVHPCILTQYEPLPSQSGDYISQRLLVGHLHMSQELLLPCKQSFINHNISHNTL